MASCRRFVCSACARAQEAWDEGDPYFVDAHGIKHYVYHPDSARDRATGVETPTLCLECAHEFGSDSAAPRTTCPSCDSTDIRARWRLEGCRCPYCRAGTFHLDPDFFAIS